MWTAKRPACRMRCHVIESRDGQNDTSGGASDTAANELTMRPRGVPPTSVVTKATPVAKRPNASRSRPASRSGAGAWRAWASAEGMRAAQRDVADQLVRAVGAERVHEAARAYVAVRARERVTVAVPGAARDGERPVDDARRGLVHEGLGRLGVREQRDDVGAGLVHERGGARERRAAGAELDRVLGDQHARAPVGLPPA